MASAIRKAIRELTAAGYVEVVGRRGPHRKFYHPVANHTIMLPHSPNTDRLWGSKPKEVSVAVELGRAAGNG